LGVPKDSCIRWDPNLCVGIGSFIGMSGQLRSILVGPSNHVFVGDPCPAWKEAFLRGNDIDIFLRAAVIVISRAVSSSIWIGQPLTQLGVTLNFLP